MYSVNEKKWPNSILFNNRQATPFKPKASKKSREVQTNFDEIDVESQTDLKHVMIQNLREYCDWSTIHGVKYIGKRKRIERISWTIICILLLCGCGTQIYEIVGKWRKNPLVFLLDTKVTPIKEIDFPAVTICPQRLPNRDKFNYTDFLYRFLNDKDMEYSYDELMLFDAISKICYRGLLKYVEKLEPYLEEIPNFNNTDLIDVMDKYFLPNFLKFFFCKGIVPKHHIWECNLRFTRIWLKEGLCYSFNLLPRDQIFRPGVLYPLAEKPNLIFPQDEPRRSNAEAYMKDLGEFTTPYRVSNRRERLHVRTRFYEDFTDSTCDPDVFVFIHNPYEIPWDRQSNGLVIQVDEFVKNVLTITPSVISTDQSLKRAFTSEERDCFFEDERPLKFFQKYSQNNCELECMTNASFHPDHFNCSSFWMPRTADIPLCHFQTYLMWYNVETQTTSDLENCNCLPDCNYVDYSVSMSHSHTPYFDDNSITKDDIVATGKDQIAAIWIRNLERKLYLALNKSYNFEIPLDKAARETNLTVDFNIWKWKFTEIEVHYEDSDFLAMRRHLAYSFADFVSQIGGIFGCFLGISIFSIIEIVYFCTVRMLKVMNKGKKYEKKEEKQPERQIKVITIMPKIISHSEKY